MLPRDPDEPHRAASSLELFFDLTFVVGVSVAAHELLHAEQTGAVQGIVLYLAAFFAVWWAWVNFTWFASAFDTDDWLYRVLTIVQMGGVLVTAAGIPAMIEHGSFALGVIGYVVMRLALVAQWLRAGRHPGFRVTAIRYAIGVTVVQIGWCLLLVVPRPGAYGAIGVLIALEFAVPVWAERRRVTPFHRKHIAERYGLFTLIVLGEGLLSVANALIDAQGSARGWELVLLGATALVLIAGLWWIYFARESPVLATGMRGTFAFGYLHYVIFGAAAALAAGLELSIGLIEEPGGAEARGPSALQPTIHAATTVPVALFLLATWFLVLRGALGPGARRAVPVLAVLVGAAALVPYALQVAALLVIAIVVVLEVDGRSRAVS
ncbi:MAG: low temperature requirement protein A [Acidobacteria bacterium]|nr:low temperature requirement protein A [Acidobacteriota bacterium]